MTNHNQPFLFNQPYFIVYHAMIDYVKNICFYCEEYLITLYQPYIIFNQPLLDEWIIPWRL